MPNPRVFISFDYDNDEDIKILLAGQAKLSDSPFDFKDASVKDHLPGDWKEKVKRRLQNCDQMIVLCGTRTHLARGVAAELEIAQEINLPYFCLKGRSDRECKWPTSAKGTDKMYDWTWPNLRLLIGGSR
jgi:hypothetical protein